MRIIVGYQPDYVETEVDLTPEEITNALVGALKDGPVECARSFARAISGYHRFLESTPDELIQELGPRARQITVDVLRKQAERFAAFDAAPEA